MLANRLTLKWIVRLAFIAQDQLTLQNQTISMEVCARRAVTVLQLHLVKLLVQKATTVPIMQLTPMLPVPQATTVLKLVLRIQVTPLNIEFVLLVTIVQSAQLSLSLVMQVITQNHKVPRSLKIVTSVLPVFTVQLVLQFLILTLPDSVHAQQAITVVPALQHQHKLYVAEVTTVLQAHQLKFGVPKVLTKTPLDKQVVNSVQLGTIVIALIQLLTQLVLRATIVHQALSTLHNTHVLQVHTEHRRD